MLHKAKELLTLVNREYRYEVVNSAYCLAHNLTQENIIGKTVAEMWGENLFETSIKPSLDQAFSGKEIKFQGWFNFSLLGRRYFEVFYHPWMQGDEITHVVIVSYDKTDQKIFEDKTERFNQRLNFLRETSGKFLSNQSSKEIAKEALKQLQALVPFSKAGILVINPETREAFIVARNFDGTISENEDSDLFSTPVNKSSTVKKIDEWFEQESENADEDMLESLMFDSEMKSLISLPMEVEGKLVGAMILGSKQKKAFEREQVELAKHITSQLALAFYNSILYEQVQSSQKQLQVYTSQVVSAQEDERKRISLELHDQTGQTLTALKLQLVLLKEEISQENRELREKFQPVIQMVEEITDQIRFLARDLHPPSLRGVGLYHTIQYHSQQMARHLGLQAEIIGEEIPDLPDPIQINLFRVVQEGLNNIAKHAQAKRIKIHLNHKKALIYLQIEDDGKGFQMSTVSQSNSGIGLFGMRERINSLGGTLVIRSQPGKGTTIIARVPFGGVE
ncbi:MAG: PAS domain-containing protein [Anaerolineae bacterium]|nr:PAS domain-containing protein [Anaerolineae bacterium]